MKCDDFFFNFLIFFEILSKYMRFLEICQCNIVFVRSYEFHVPHTNLSEYKIMMVSTTI